MYYDITFQGFKASIFIVFSAKNVPPHIKKRLSIVFKCVKIIS